MPFDLDSLTVDPSKRGDIYKESNQSIKSYAKNAQAQLSEVQQINRDLREIESSEFMVDKIADQQAASNMLNMVDATQSTLSGVDATVQTLEATFATQLGRLTELQDIFSRPTDLSEKDLKQAEKEFKQLDQQALKTKKTLDAVRNEAGAIRNARAQTLEQYTARHAISKQARDNNEAVARSMTLQNRQQSIDEKLKSDGTILNLINSRQTLTPGEVDQEQRDSMELFEFMYFTIHQGQNMDTYGRQQAREMQGVFSSMAPEEQRALMLANTEYMRSKYTGTPMELSQYKELLAEKGETTALETIAKLSGDTGVQDAIQVGKQQLFSRLYKQASDEALAALPVAERVNGLSPQQQRQIATQVQAQVASTNSRDILPEALGVVSAEVSNNARVKGQEIFSSVSEAPEELLSPLIFPPKIRDYFMSDEAKEIMTVPNMTTGVPLLETADKLVKSMQRQGISGSEAVTATANLIGQSAKAGYKTRPDFGSGQYSDTLQTLERLGFGTNTGVFVPPPSTRNLPASAAGRTAYDLSNPTDLQAAIAYLQKFTKSRENVKTQQQGAQAATNAVTRGAPVSQYGLPMYQPPRN
jgi:hypothetical protein